MAPRRTVESECKRAQQILKITALAKRGGTAGERQAAEAALERIGATPTDIVLAETQPKAPAAKRPKKLTKGEIRKRQRAGAYHDGTLPLTTKRVQRLKGAGRYRDGLSRGLYLQISPAGARSWVLRYELAGREHMLGLGSEADFTLRMARERAREARRQIADGLDPVMTRRAAKAAARAAAAKALTFREAARAYFDQHQAKWTSAVHREQFWSSLTLHAFPVLGAMDVAMINTADVLKVLQPSWVDRAITLDRVRNRIEGILDWCTVAEHRPPVANPARWKGRLDQLLPPARKVRPVKHFAAMPYVQVPAFMAQLREVQGTAARLVEFLVLTAVRRDEARLAVWNEIDFDQALWTIPPNRTKAKREHRVPLAPAVVDLLHRLPRDKDNPYLFVGPTPGASVGRMSLTRLMQQLGCGDTLHGFRSSFSDWANEATRHPNLAIELALGHAVGSSVEKSYRRGDMVPKRIKLMADWSRYCTTKPVAKGDNVVTLRAGAVVS